jgi:ribose transport system ATP-binding protein
MLSVYEGVGLYLRPSPAGSIAGGVVSVGNAAVAHIVVWTLVAAAVAIAADLAIRRSRWGLKLRAVGFDRDRAQRLGVASRRVRLGAFVLSGAFAGLAGFLLAAQTGTGDATVGSSYILIAIAVPVIGGASLLGGRGTMIGCVVAGLILASIESVVSFANLPGGYYQVAVGVLTLLALAISLTRRRMVERREHAEVQAGTPAEA